MKFLKLDGLFDKLVGLVENKIEVAKLELKEEASKLVAKVLVKALLAVIAIFLVLFLSLSLAFYFSILMHNYALGFLTVGGIYLLLLGLLILIKDKIGLDAYFETKIKL